MSDGKPIADVLREAFIAHLGATGESLQKIKLGRGAVGKITVIAVASILAIAGVALKLSTTASILIAVAILGVVCLTALGCVLYVLVKRPEMALLEGAELVLYQHVALAAKGQPPLAVTGAPIPEHLLPGTPQPSLDEPGESA